MKRKEKNVRAWTRCINRSPLCSILEYCGVNKYHVRPQHKPRLKLYKIKIIRKGFMKWGWINTLMVRMNRENISMVMTETGHSMHSFTIASWCSCQTWEQQYNVNDRCWWFWSQENEDDVKSDNDNGVSLCLSDHELQYCIGKALMAHHCIESSWWSYVLKQYTKLLLILSAEADAATVQ